MRTPHQPRQLLWHPNAARAAGATLAQFGASADRARSRTSGAKQAMGRGRCARHARESSAGKEIARYEKRVNFEK